MYEGNEGVRDEPAAIIRHVNEARREHTYVFTTGGIGPTHDDITAQSIAAAFGCRFELTNLPFTSIALFYEETGALRDVVQNHLLQVIAFLAMEPLTLTVISLPDHSRPVSKCGC